MSPLKSRLYWVVAAAVSVCGVALRTSSLGEQSLWFDEAFGLMLSRLHGHIFWEAAGRDVHPPGFAILLGIWQSVFSSVAGLRFLSVAAGLISLALFWIIARELLRPGAALIAYSLWCVAPMAVYYSQELRMYAWWEVFHLAVLLCILRELEGGRGRLWSCAVAIFSVLAVYFHYYAIVTVGALWGYWVTESFLRPAIENTTKGDRLRRPLWVGLAIVAGCLPVWPMFLTQLMASSYGGALASPGKLPDYVQFVAGALQYFAGLAPMAPFQTMSRDPAHMTGFTVSFTLLYVAAVLAMLTWGAILAYRHEPRIYRLALIAAGIPVIATVLHVGLGGYFYLRCWLPMLPLCFLLLGLMGTEGQYRRIGKALIVLMWVYTATASAFSLRHAARDTSLLVHRFLASHAQPGELVVHNRLFSYLPLAIYPSDPGDVVSPTLRHRVLDSPRTRQRDTILLVPLDKRIPPMASQIADKHFIFAESQWFGKTEPETEVFRQDLVKHGWKVDRSVRLRAGPKTSQIELWIAP
ncbi:MAG: glycosyltransferase family 39 protein [bacterium]